MHDNCPGIRFRRSEGPHKNILSNFDGYSCYGKRGQSAILSLNFLPKNEMQVADTSLDSQCFKQTRLDAKIESSQKDTHHS